MKPVDTRRPRGEQAAPADPAIRENPLAYIAEEHLRQREVCAALDRLAADAQANGSLATEVLQHLTTYLPRHIRNEEADLFPLLRQRSDPSDEINETLDRLHDSHVQSLTLMTPVRKILQRLITKNAAPSATEAANLKQFADHERRHLIVENAIVLPLARARLTQKDIRFLQQKRNSIDMAGKNLC